jgi:hypothetical protein
MKRLVLLLALTALVTAAWAQVTPVGPGTGVAGSVLYPTVGNPATGDYSAIVNAYIAPYAQVTAYDNWITFDSLTPTATDAVVAVGHVGPTTVNGNSPAVADLAGFAVDTNSRLNLAIDMNGFMSRVDEDGVPFAGLDTRKASGNYQLKNQYKIAYFGKFLAADPLETESGTALASGTSGVATDYDKWTSWAAGGVTEAAPAGAITDETGWLYPVDSGAADAWTGLPTPASSGNQLINAVIERGQAGAPGNSTGPGGAQVWIAEQIQRRGLQDVSGNYLGFIDVTLTYREAPGVWDPSVDPTP